MTLRHRVVYQSNKPAELLKVAEEAWKNWVLSKNYEDADPSLVVPNGEFIQISKTRRTKREEISEQHLSAVRITDATNGGEGIYSTVITWVSDGIGAWVQIDGNAPDAESPYQPPKISNYLFEAAAKSNVILFDSSPHVRYTPAPQVIDPHNLDEFVSEVLESPKRTTLTFVAGTEYNADRSEWSTVLEESLFSKVIGMTTIWLLNAEATEIFNNQVPLPYRVLPSSIHAFQPGLDLGRPSDSARHRWFPKALIGEAITGSARYLQNRLYYLARSTSLEVELPDALTQADSLLGDREAERFANRLLRFDVVKDGARLRRFREALHSSRYRSEIKQGPVVPVEPVQRPVPKPRPVAPVESEPALKIATPQPFSSGVESSLTELIEMSNLKAHNVDLSEDGLIALVDLAEKGSDSKIRIEELRDKFVNQAQRLKQSESSADLLSRELARAERLLSEIGDLNRKLYKELVAIGAPSEAYTPPVARPDSIIELLGRLDDFPHLIFTGDSKAAEALDDRPNSKSITERCWSVLQVLEDYAENYPKHGSVERFLRSDDATLLVNVPHAPSESDSVENTAKFRRPRELPVPLSIDASGKIFMGAHFKINNDGGKAPRMHYFDAMGEDKHIYIGYLGAHLPNTMTS